MNLLRATATVGGMTMASRVVGFVRDILIAAVIGAGPIADAFFVAFRIPNLFRRLFAEGAFSAGFVPLFLSMRESDGRAAAQRFAEDALAALVVALAVLVGVFEIAMPWLMLGLAPGFASDPSKFDLAVTLTRVTFPYLLLVSAVSLYGGLLNAAGRFAAMAATPILLNVFLIGALLGFGGMLPTAAHALAWGIAAAGVAQLVWLAAWAARAGFVLRPRVPRWTSQVRALGGRMLPAVVGAGVAQINIAVDILLASLLPTGAISYLFFADRLTQLPLGVVGVATGTALLPLLSRQLAAGEGAAASGSFNRAVEIALLLALPAAAALIAAAEPVVQVLFERGAFDPAATAATAAALLAYAVGVPAYVLVKVLSPGYFARGDTRTPVRIAMVALATNVALNLALMGPLQHVGLALATALSAWLNAGLLYGFLRRRGQFVPDARLRRAFPRLVLAAAGLGLGVWLAAAALEAPLAGSAAARVGALALLVVGGLSLYAALVVATGAERPGALRTLARGGETSG